MIVIVGNFGLLLWQRDYDGAMDYTYQGAAGNIWNDFDSEYYRDHVFAYPTIDGVIDTIQWEGWREGVDDIRYLTTLLNVIERDKAERRDTSAAEAWLTELKGSDLTTRNLDVVRSEIIDHILYIQSYPPERNLLIIGATLAFIAVMVSVILLYRRRLFGRLGRR